MNALTFDTGVYLGDIHGARLRHLKRALRALSIKPSGLLCTMDLDQILSMQELAKLQKKFDTESLFTALAPGNHEAAVIHRIGIDSSTYREKHQDTNILSLIEAFNLPNFSEVREFVEQKLDIVGGIPFSLDESGELNALLIHGALAGKEEKYIHEFPEPLQEHVRERSDLWLRLENGSHLKANFSCMEKEGVHVMMRGHDHYTAMRSMDNAGVLSSHQLVVNKITEETLAYDTKKPRSKDSADDLLFVDPERLQTAQADNDLYWHELSAGRRYVINFGPYYQGYFGMVRSAKEDRGAAVAFCRTGVSFYNETDREERLKPFLSAHQARRGKSFYELFPSEGSQD